MKHILTIAIILILGFSTLNTKAQYTNGIGLRGGWTVGLSVKHFIAPQGALEGMLTNHVDGIGYIFRAMFEFQQRNHNYNLFEIANVFWFAGGGLHTRFVVPFAGTLVTQDRGAAIGAAAIAGIEYKIPHLPITLGIDLCPWYEFFTTQKVLNDLKNTFNLDGGLTARFIF
jgi:hypothetical protein